LVLYARNGRVPVVAAFAGEAQAPAAVPPIARAAEAAAVERRKLRRVMSDIEG
jgi:hypothetical protein